MAASHLAYPDQAFDKLSGTDPNQYSEYFSQMIERKLSFGFADAPSFSFLLGSSATEWYENNVEVETTWDEIITNIIYRFSDG